VLTRRDFLGAAALASPTMRALAPRGTQRSRLILLGTAGGPTPKPNRAAPAQAIVIGDATYLIDCGNGVARQLALAGVRLGTLRSVFVTHHHSDHNADYGTVLLLAWAADLVREVRTYGPPPLVAMTGQMLELHATDIRTRIADEGRPPLAPLIVPSDIVRGGVVHEDANVRVTAAVVDHPPLAPALAYRFDCADRSIVISGDTRPSEALIALAKDADILLHEVMHLPSLDALIASEPNATTLRAHLLASHTTTEQVGQVATAANVKTLVLSHFVPGGPPIIPDQVWLDAVRPHFGGGIVVGRDLLEM
jgi:ribonuclease BN (tRNA processing enzyme)